MKKTLYNIDYCSANEKHLLIRQALANEQLCWSKVSNWNTTLIPDIPLLMEQEALQTMSRYLHGAGSLHQERRCPFSTRSVETTQSPHVKKPEAALRWLQWHRGNYQVGTSSAEKDVLRQRCCWRGTAHRLQGRQMTLLEGPGYVSRATTCKRADEIVFINVL